MPAVILITPGTLTAASIPTFMAPSTAHRQGDYNTNNISSQEVNMCQFIVLAIFEAVVAIAAFVYGLFRIGGGLSRGEESGQ